MSAPVVAEARAWIGTPYLHQASLRGVGCDCLGLVRGVWRACVGPEPEAPPAYTPDWGEAPGEEVLLAAALRHLKPRSPADRAPGDVLLFRMRARGVAKHLGILSDRRGSPHVIHAWAGHGVVETPLTGPWARRVVMAFAFPGPASDICP
ncbi:MAG: peptidase [Rhodobacteraceae bacterium]|nr:peptidase [Paracoccaceae bacterium]